MLMTANVLESLTRLVILNCFNRTWIVCISGVFGISWTLMSRNAKLWKLLRRFNYSLLVFFLENSVLEEVKEFKDLGIITNHHLSWNPHIDHIVSKANRMLGLIKRTCKGLDDPETLCTFYCSLVRSNLEYIIVQWCGPHIQKEILISWREYREGRLNLS